MLTSVPTCTGDQKNYVDTCKDISGKLQLIIHQALADFKESKDEFLSQKIGKLFQVVGLYRQAFEKLNVKTKSEFDGLARRYFSSPEVRDAFDEITQSERDWDEALEEIDKTLNTSVAVQLKEDHLCEIVARQAELKQFGAEILIVSFGEQLGADNWLKETNCPFDMILDPYRKIYLSFGLHRSVSKVWSCACMVYYVEQLLKGRQLPRPLENVHDDPQQMGGDFILDNTGRVVFSYCSKVSNDRPSVDQILAAIHSHHSG
ncbi:peroxiredoxin-like 2C [Biomphalaria pfeifferi]|uniref:Peroxiredoxin-like 2C n=1 Tax=Biomphalaria pfeifferi TaxID=112525 RepID=A0AAD8BCW7_BIOPF|nr:peroxiredoxin-like 2C [Biomphalaria pfeifferi]